LFKFTTSDDRMAIIQRKSLATEVASQIEAQILNGQYAVNQKLPVEQKLMDYFGVGRSTVREAVKILVNSGYLRVQQGLGTFVEDNSGVHETVAQRIKKSNHLLEMKIAEKAAVTRSANDISKMEHYLEKRRRAAYAGLNAEFVDAHIEFYQAIADACKNTILTDLFKSFSKQLKNEMMDEYRDTKLINIPTDLHYKLLESIMRQDPSRAWYWSGKINGQFT
jgi:DNA-binding FadR family transcriptional regulator